MNDQLILRAIDRDSDALEALYDYYAPQLLSVSYRYCGNGEDAEDCLHEGFIKIIRNLHRVSFRSEPEFRSWMKQIVINTSLNHLRDKRKKFPASEGISGAENIPVESDDPAGDFPYPDISREQILEIAASLPDGYRSVFNLYVIEQYSHREIATLLGISENTSKTQLFKARAILRKKLENVSLNERISSYEK